MESSPREAEASLNPLSMMLGDGSTVVLTDAPGPVLANEALVLVDCDVAKQGELSAELPCEEGWSKEEFSKPTHFSKVLGMLVKGHEVEILALLKKLKFDAIEQVGGLTSELLSQRTLRKGELEELIWREEIHWRQKGRVKWVKEGDCNSKFFHKVANGKQNRKYIKELENERGLVLRVSQRRSYFTLKSSTQVLQESLGVLKD